MKVVIVGGGIMGCSTAYYLREEHAALKKSEPLEIVIIERLNIACAASGKAGGFLAKNWCVGELAPLAEISFDMHSELANKFGHESLEYRRIKTFSGKVTLEKKPLENVSQRHAGKSATSSDFFPKVFNKNKLQPGMSLGTESTTAQLIPLVLTNMLLKHSGASVVYGELVEVVHDKAKISSVIIEQRDTKERLEVFADEFCFCMGVWSDALRNMKLKVPKSLGRRMNSLVIKAREELIPHLSKLNLAVFTDYKNMEIILREKGIVYFNSSDQEFQKVTEKPGAVVADSEACEKILAAWETVTSKATVESKGTLEETKLLPKHGNVKYREGHGTEVKIMQSCYLPLIDHVYKDQQLPVMCSIPKTSNGYICTGHTCWGILLAPISGKIMANLILHKNTSAVINTTAFQLK